MTDAYSKLTDGSPEFSGAFAALAAQRGIPLSKGEPDTHEKVA
jgi:hypothetical protein